MLVEQVQQPQVPSAPVNNKPVGNNSKIVIIVLAVLLAAALVVAGIFAVRSFGNKNEENNDSYVSEDETYVETTAADGQPEQLVPETTTIPEITTRAILAETSKADAYASFNRFYKSYIYAINAYNGSYITDCTPQVRSEMVERFEINKKSLFDLKSIDFDEFSVSVTDTDYFVDYTFFVNCETMLYNRVTNEQKSLNYSCWEVTVRYENGMYQVTRMVRDNDHIMSTDIHTIVDSEPLF